MSVLSRLRTSKVAKNSLSAYFTQFSTLICGLATIPVLVRFLSKEEIAIWVLASTMNAYMSLFDLGIGDSIGRKIAGAVTSGEQTEINRWWSVSLAVLALLALIILSIGLALTPFFGGVLNISGAQAELANQVFAWMVVITALSMLSRGMGGILVAQERTHLSLLVQALSAWVNLFLVISLLYMGLGLFACVLAFAARMLVIWILHGVLIRSGPNPPEWDAKGLDLGRVKSLFCFSISFSFTVLVDVALSAIPPLALAKFGATASIPALAFSGRAPTLLANVANRTVWAFYPGMLQLQLAGRTVEMSGKHRRTSLMGFAIALFVAGGILAFNRSFVAILADESFYVGDAANAVLAMIVIITPTSHLFRCFLSLGGTMGKVIPVSLGSTGLSVVLSWLGYRTFGLPGLLVPLFLPVIALGVYGWFHGLKSCGIPRSSMSLVGLYSALAACVLLCLPAWMEQFQLPTLHKIEWMGRIIPLPSYPELAVFLVCCAVSACIAFKLFKSLRAIPATVHA